MLRSLYLAKGAISDSLGNASLRSSRRLRCTRAQAKKKNEDDSPYRATVNLPQTKFNMRANSKQTEPKLQDWWHKNKIYETLSRENEGEPFILHDGPPYANGDLHIGHALNKILKDFIVKFQLLQGRKSVYRPGWDCHGLPIELKVVQTMTEEQRAELTPIQLRRKAREFAVKTMKQQRAQFQRYGVWGEWEQPYLTLNAEYEAAQLRVFAAMVAKGIIYRGRKPVHWSPSSRTALAEAELEYPDGHTSRSIYVAMPITGLGPDVPVEARQHVQGAHLAIWTTTPWTIPANAAVAVNAELLYAVVQAEGSGPEQKLVVADALIEALQAKLGCQLSKLTRIKGSELEGASYRHPLSSLGGDLARDSPVVIGGDYITTDSGTGLVHTAPGHGIEDYQVGLRYNLPVLSPLDDGGIFTAAAGAPFEGKSVLGDGNAAVVAALQNAGALLKEEKYPHRYPYDWRTKQPVIFRATEQWFASVEGFKAAALEAIQGVQWIPSSGLARITAMTQSRSDWCISRQRKWGVPLPVFYDTETGEAIMTQETIEHVASVVEQKGTDVWWAAPIEVVLPPSLQARAGTLRRGDDTMDVWFDSGCSWASVLGAGDSASSPQGLGFPAQLYLEGSDQHRGWFQSSLLTAVAATGRAPYCQVLTHGFVLDEAGIKMSKSIGNVTDPRTVIEGGKDAEKDPAYGADVLRLWVASVDFTADVLVGGKILAQTSEVYRKLRFTLRYLLSNLHDFDPAAQSTPYQLLPVTDRYMLRRLSEVLEGTKAAYTSYAFLRAFQTLQRFAVQDLSNFYLDIAKDRLYVRALDSTDRRACQTVMAAILGGMLSALAPMAPHLAEDAWQNLPYPAPAQSVFQAGWREPDPAWAELNADEAAAASALNGIRTEVNQVIEEARRRRLVGASLEARVLLHVEQPYLAEQLQHLNSLPNGADPLRYTFIVSQADLCSSPEAVKQAAPEYNATVNVAGHSTVTIGVAHARGRKCQRCWNYSEAVGSADDHPQLCERCVPVVRAMGMKPVPVSKGEPAAVA